MFVNQLWSNMKKTSLNVAYFCKIVEIFSTAKTNPVCLASSKQGLDAEWNPELLGFGRQVGQINSGAFGVILSKTISTHFGTLSPLSMIFIIPPSFLQKTKIFNKYLFEIGIWIWAPKNWGFSLHVSVVCGWMLT